MLVPWCICTPQFDEIQENQRSKDLCFETGDIPTVGLVSIRTYFDIRGRWQVDSNCFLVQTRRLCHFQKYQKCYQSPWRFYEFDYYKSQRLTNPNFIWLRIILRYRGSRVPGGSSAVPQRMYRIAYHGHSFSLFYTFRVKWWRHWFWTFVLQITWS